MKRRSMVMAAALLLTLAACTVGWAQSETPAPEYTIGETAGPAHGAGSGPAYLSVVELLGKLLVAVLVAWGLVQAVRWWQDRHGATHGTGAGGRLLRIEESLSLGADGRLYLVEVDGRRLLLGGSEGAVVQIADLSDGPSRPSIYRSIKHRADGGADELTIAHRPISTEPVRPDLVETGETESWEQRRNRLLRELQEQ
ncbi:MAG: flagellar biosynthetic protein FliO [Armatimonadota bacterium]